MDSFGTEDDVVVLIAAGAGGVVGALVVHRAVTVEHKQELVQYHVKRRVEVADVLDQLRRQSHATVSVKMEGAQVPDLVIAEDLSFMAHAVSLVSEII